MQSKEQKEALLRLRDLHESIDNGKHQAQISLAKLKLSNPDLFTALVPLYDLLAHLDDLYMFKSNLFAGALNGIMDRITGECDCENCKLMKVRH